MWREPCPGVCAEHVRTVDWGATALGPQGDWPVRLVGLLDTIFRSAAPKLLLWGHALTTFYNDAFLELIGQLGTNGIGQAYPQFRPKLWPEIAPQVRAALAGESCGQTELLLPRRSGETSCYQLFFTPVRDFPSAQPGVLIDVYDVSAARQLESKLRRENDRLNRLFAAAPVFIAHGFGAELRLEFVNRAFVDLFGGRPLLGLPATEAIPEMTEQGFDAIVSGVLRSGEPWVGTDIKIRLRNPGSEGEQIRYVDFLYQPVRDEDGSVTGVLCAGYDVTERHLAQLEAEQLRHQLLHASRVTAMGTMAMTLAHELNQPLATAVNYLGVARRELAGSGGPSTMVDHAEAEIARAGDVIRRMRSLVRSGRAERDPIPLQRTFERTIELFRAAGSDALAITASIAPGAAHVMADEVQLEQVLLNLLSNAAHASRDAARKEAVLSAAPAGKGRVALCVRDFGCGFADGQIERAFEPAIQPGGAGLGVGLALTRTIVEANCGEISLGNAADGGAIVTILLDAADAP